MSGIGSCELEIESGVEKFLKRPAVQEEFQITLDLVQTHFPEVRVVKVRLQEDPDEEDIWRVVLDAYVPESHPLALLQEQERHYYDALVERVPPERFPFPLCCLSINFARE